MEKKENVGLLMAENRTETRDGLSMLVHYITQRNTEKEQSEYFKTKATNG